ncbi:MAG: nicotinate phosphoribosyltransferase [Halobacteriales archaeon]|nr:nicotinate phosphoribosyltransferase [Halobacteriales archaeon]
MGRRYDIVTPEEIDDGLATDAYFERTETILEGEGVNPEVVADIGEEFETPHVFVGLKDVARLLEGQDVDLYALPEGSLFERAPAMRVEGEYLEFGRYETAILGFICRASAVASATARVKAVAGDVPVVSFGTRREHPSTAAMIERSAHIGGADGVSNVAGAREVGLEATGTMPHALVICMRDQKRAWKAYDEHVAEEVPRIMLCDTYEDEKKESIAAADALGDALDSVRLDTTGSRRGDMREIVEEVRWELDIRGYDDIDIFVSGGIGVEEVLELRDVADGFGVGGSIASIPPVDFSLDIVEVEGEFAGKRGEKSGKKEVVHGDDG